MSDRLPLVDVPEIEDQESKVAPISQTQNSAVRDLTVSNISEIVLIKNLRHKSMHLTNIPKRAEIHSLTGLDTHSLRRGHIKREN